jgi:hypothetical protein
MALGVFGEPAFGSFSGGPQAGDSRLISPAAKGSASHLFSSQLVILDAGRDVALTGI